ncbi:hypothetical protein PRJBM_00599 [Bartonella henselae]|uniref:Uncharacterized protein n=1 Tax=Bartonella henselae TaxID=38323 RepID=X5MF50_BARHN|nr:hypothetical protein Q653_01076 [Bartonella henselae JK 42]ETS09848.1 hypothetical protein Q654_00126 [Bartonella henselae JK 50]ETS10358.1 hypothetical protein Q655_00077 [Bartonella henselae JK 51]ETS12401.1 hypothetical protein Q652_01206 [Bartonella henselae JK 41]KEC56691.1 hypothetical protein O97_01231 [Bartonella henselae str. Zeus]KEC61526.1 hypothetical protein O95_00896 [Bartonella henselae JK 53]CDO39989.1 hypothetical protein PRJBM_00599 [Bartonella henselae]
MSYLEVILVKEEKISILLVNLGVMIFGNDGISRLAKRYGFFS